jgi:hypothetical protein
MLDIFHNYCCPQGCGEGKKLAQVAQMLTIYIEEAHPYGKAM